MDCVFVFFCAGRESLFGNSSKYKRDCPNFFRKILFGVDLLGDLSPMRRSRLELGRDNVLIY